jgi:hypothetical protein
MPRKPFVLRLATPAIEEMDRDDLILWLKRLHAEMLRRIFEAQWRIHLIERQYGHRLGDSNDDEMLRACDYRAELITDIHEYHDIVQTITKMLDEIHDRDEVVN